MRSAANIPDPGGVTDAEFAERRARALDAAMASGLDGLLVLSRGGTSLEWYADNLYLAGVHSPCQNLADTDLWADHSLSALILSAVDGRATLVVNGGDLEADALPVDEVHTTTHVARTLADVLRAQRLDGAKLGIDGSEAISLKSWRNLVSALGHEPAYENADGLVRRLRVVKSPAELDRVRAAARAGVEAMSALLGAVAEGRTEADVVAAGVAEFMRSGGMPLDVPVASGPHAQRYWGNVDVPNLHGTRRLEHGDLLHADFYGAVGGYFTDLARGTVVGGRPTAAQREVLELGVALIEDVLLPLVRPGTTGGEVHAAASHWLVEQGLADEGLAFWDVFPTFGHGLGLSILEEPLIVAGNETVFAPGMVIALEAFVGRTAGATYFEHSVIVTPDGYELLTGDCPSVWWQ